MSQGKARVPRGRARARLEMRHQVGGLEEGQTGDVINNVGNSGIYWCGG